MPPNLREPFKVLVRFLIFQFIIVQKIDSSGEYLLRIWIKCFFFHSTIYNRKCAYLSFKNSIPAQFTSALWSLFRLWPVKKEEIEAFF
jgi:hypothetical protein